MTKNLAIHACQLRKRFGSDDVLNDVSLMVEPGELFALLGPNGCGKTTTLRVIAGLEQASGGSLQIAGRTVIGPELEVSPEARRVGLVFQEYALFPHMTVAENVAFGLRPRQPARVSEMLRMMQLEPLAEAYPDQLSGGQRQRTAIARALAPRPVVLLLDEPFSGQDPARRREMREQLRRVLKQTGTTAIFVTHDLEEAFFVADRVGVMLNGRVVQIGPPHQIYQHPGSEAVAKMIGDGNLLDPDQDAELMLQLGLGQPPWRATWIRAEDFLLDTQPLAHSVSVGIQEVQFYGHDELALVVTAEGRQLRVRRLTADQRWKTGSQAFLRLRPGTSGQTFG